MGEYSLRLGIMTDEYGEADVFPSNNFLALRGKYYQIKARSQHGPAGEETELVSTSSSTSTSGREILWVSVPGQAPPVSQCQL